MTKEELKEKRNRTIESLDDIKAVLSLDELYIDELKKACDETQELLDKQIEATYKLDKENAELKNERNAFKTYSDGAELDAINLNERLIKAKEIIKTFLGFAEAFGYSPSMDKFITETEQFLKEIK